MDFKQKTKLCDCGKELEQIDADCDENGYFPIYEDCECKELDK